MTGIVSAHCPYDARCMDKVMATQPLWGLLKFGRELADGTGRDWFLATRTDMARSVLYDTFIPVYKSDCDYFARVQHQGWLVSNHVDFCGELPIKVGCAAGVLEGVEGVLDIETPHASCLTCHCFSSVVHCKQ